MEGLETGLGVEPEIIWVWKLGGTGWETIEKSRSGIKGVGEGTREGVKWV